MSPHRCLSREIDRPEIATTRALAGVNPCVISLGIEMREAGICREIAEGQHGVGLAAAHRLLEFEDRLSRVAGEPLKPLPQQRVACRR